MRMKMIGIMLLAAFIAGSGSAYACVGARPLALGGAFIGLADDVNATYWNPAGLAQMQMGKGAATWMHTTTNRDSINYQDFAAVATRFDAPKLGGKLAFGASYVRDDSVLLLGGNPVADTEDWFWASIAMDAGKYGMFGLNIRTIDDTAHGYNVDSEIGLDAGYLYRVNDQLSFGMLVQDFNTPDINVPGYTPITRVRNWRAGIAFKPKPGTVVTFDAYDITDDGNSRSARFGYETKLGNITARAGYYGIASDFDSGPTIGFGYTRDRVTFDGALLMGDFDNTLLLSASLSVN